MPPKIDWDTENCIGPFKGEYRFLSNFYEQSFTMGTTTFPTAEHAFQAMKAVDQPEIFEEIVYAQDAKAAKRKGKKPDLPDNWSQKKKYVMTDVVTAKFSQNEVLRDNLLSTSNETLVELNHWGDTYWGAKKSNGRGKNMLGIILMSVRDTLRSVE